MIDVFYVSTVITQFRLDILNSLNSLKLKIASLIFRNAIHDTMIKASNQKMKDV